MIKLNLQFLVRDGRREFVILPYEEFEQLRTRLENVEDVTATELAHREGTRPPTVSLEEMQRRLGIID
jgi:hypothetical protein